MSDDKATGRKIYLLDDKDCPPCEEVKAALKEEIESGKVEVLSITSDEAMELLAKAGVDDEIEFPSALIDDEKGVRVCEIYHSDDITLSKCGDDIIAIRERPGLEEVVLDSGDPGIPAEDV